MNIASTGADLDGEIRRPRGRGPAPLFNCRLRNLMRHIFPFLSAGDPSRGSTGVHERGTEPFRLSALARHHWPTVTLVDGSIARAPERVERVIAQARQYAEQFLGDSPHHGE